MLMLEGRFPIPGEKSVQHVDRLALRFAYIVLSLPARYHSQPRAPPETVTTAPFSVMPLLHVPRHGTPTAGVGEDRACLGVAPAARDGARHCFGRLLFLLFAARHHPLGALGRSAPGG